MLVRKIIVEFYQLVTLLCFTENVAIQFAPSDPLHYEKYPLEGKTNVVNFKQLE